MSKPMLFDRWSGKKSAADARNLGRSDLMTSQNVIAITPNELRARLGWVRITDIAGAGGPEGDILSIYYWPEGGKYLFQSLSAVGSYDIIETTGAVNASVVSNNANNYRLEGWASYRYGADNVALMAQHTALGQWTGAAYTDLSAASGAPKAKDVLVYYDQVWTFGDLDNPSRAARCNNNDQTEWVEGNAGYMDLGAGDGGVLRYGVLWGGEIWGFKTGENPSIWRISGTPTQGFWNQIYIPDSPEAMCKPIATPYGLIFAARGTLHALQGVGPQARLVEIADSIQPDLSNFAQLFENRARITMGYDHRDKMVHVTYTGLDAGGVPGWYTIFGRPISPGRWAWGTHSGYELTAFRGGDRLVAAGSSGGTYQLYRYGTSSFSEVPSDYDGTWDDVECVVETAETDFGAPEILKLAESFLCDINVDGTVTKEATCEMYIDGETSARTTCKIRRIDKGQRRQKVSLRFKTARVKVSWAQSYDPTKLDRYGSEKRSRIHYMGFDATILGNTKGRQITA